jgi:hypothetical protein
MVAESARRTIALLNPVFGKNLLRVGVGVAAPAIEAWYEFGLDSRATEAGWRAVPRDQQMTRKRELKDRVARRHGTIAGVNPEAAASDAHRVCKEIDKFARAFASGFGPLAAAVRSWAPTLE